MSAFDEDIKQIQADWEAVHRLIGAMGERKFLIAVLEKQERVITLANKIDQKRMQIEKSMEGTGVSMSWSYRKHANGTPEKAL